MNFHGKTVNNQPIAQWKAICTECAKHERFTVKVEKYDEAKEISEKQMAFLHAVVLPLLSNWNGDSQQEWENRLKLECGSKWFKPQFVTIDGHEFTIIPSKKTLSIKNFSEWYTNIRDFALKEGITIPDPDPEWRKNQERSPDELSDDIF